MHIELDITGSSLKYTAGDHVALLPENSAQLVEKIANLLSVDLETVFSLVNKDGVCVCRLCNSHCCAVTPMNMGGCVSVLSWVITVSPPELASKKNPFPCPTTYRSALLHYVDIASPLRTHVLREMAEYAQDSQDKDFLMNLTAPTEEGKVPAIYLAVSLTCTHTRTHFFGTVPS